MTQQLINLGQADRGNGDPLRTAFSKVNANFTELYSLTGVQSLTELAQDYAAEMLVNGTHAGVSVEYNDTNNTLNITVEQDIDGGASSTFFDDDITINGGGA
jgi:hypothetical protein